MVLRSFYMDSIDTINTGSLSHGEIEIRKLAKNVSLLPTFIVYALLLPLLMLVYHCHPPTGQKAHNLVFGCFLKPIRWITYKTVYLFFSFLRNIAQTNYR